MCAACGVCARCVSACGAVGRRTTSASGGGLLGYRFPIALYLWIVRNRHNKYFFIYFFAAGACVPRDTGHRAVAGRCPPRRGAVA